jgi:hypothetical protein
MHNAVNENQRKPKRQDACRDPRQQEKGPNSLDQSALACALVMRGGRVFDRSRRGG